MEEQMEEFGWPILVILVLLVTALVLKEFQVDKEVDKRVVEKCSKYEMMFRQNLKKYRDNDMLLRRRVKRLSRENQSLSAANGVLNERMKDSVEISNDFQEKLNESQETIWNLEETVEHLEELLDSERDEKEQMFETIQTMLNEKKELVDEKNKASRMVEELSNRCHAKNQNSFFSQMSSVFATVNDKQQQQPPAMSMCVVCQEEETTVAIAGCGHMCLCESCRDGLVNQQRGPFHRAQCPVCRGPIERTLKVFRS